MTVGNGLSFRYTLAAKSQRSGRLLVVMGARAAFTRGLIWRLSASSSRSAKPANPYSAELGPRKGRKLLKPAARGACQKQDGIVGRRGASPSSDPISHSCVAEAGGHE